MILMTLSRRTWRPEWFHGVLALVLAVLGTVAELFLFRLGWTGVHVLLCWLLWLNLLTFCYFGYDKRCACLGSRRIPELTLHGLSFLGGSPGAFVAMRAFRHKTIKGRFRFVFWLIVVLQLALFCFLGWFLWPKHS
jgi:uncharacterized membrane protein YsdA (DUF1294 family)